MRDEQAGDEVWHNDTGWKLVERTSQATWLADPISENVRKWGRTIIDPSVCVNRTSKARAEASRKADPINHPPHYNHGKIEPINVIEDWGLGFHLGNAVKYIARAEHKGTPLQDLEKAAWYLNREIEKRKKE